MLSVEENERLTRVGPGTPMGRLLRWYWHPIATSEAMRSTPVKAVRILGEDLTLFRDGGGRWGLIAQRCAHRRMDLRIGIVEDDGLRCPYHGWLYDTTGQCIDQPAEPADSVFKDKVKLTAYPVQELGGLVWAYLGEQPAPLLPRWDLFVVDNVFRQIGHAMLPCNWLQCQENSADNVHVEYMHGHFGEWVLKRLGDPDESQLQRYRGVQRHHIKNRYETFAYGMMKYRLLEGEDESTAEGWNTGHPAIFPNVVRFGMHGYKEFQIRVPIDDTTTWHIMYHAYFPGIDVPPQNPVPTFELPLSDLPEYILGQDMLAWPTQGAIVDRSLEMLGESDTGVIMWRKLLQQQLDIALEGGEPMNVFRDATLQQIDLPLEHYGPVRQYAPGQVRRGNLGDNSPYLDELDALMVRGAAAAQAPIER